MTTTVDSAAELEALSAPDLLAWAISTHGDRFAVVTSFQAEGMVLLDMAVRINPGVRIVTIDTGRLPAETYDLIDAVRDRYRIGVEVLYPATQEVERMTALHGVNLFRRDPALRKLCCQIRKVRPLDLRLAEVDAWATGLRREQSDERAGIAKAEFGKGRWKLSPLADWSAAQVEAYVAEHDLLRHPMTARGFASIGCAPCTRAIEPGEPERAGRWWWEDGSKECGLHAAPDGKLKRAVDVLLEDVLRRD